MSTRRPLRGLRRDQRSHLGPFRLVLEPLEARRLLAGIHVSVYVDQDESRSFDPTSDQAAPHRLVYVDLNSNGQRDPTEPISVTDETGAAFFAELESGDYSIGLLTNPQSRVQVDPVGLTRPELVSSRSIESFVASDDLEVVWSLDSSGVARLVKGPSDLPTQVNLGNIVVRGETQADRFAAIVKADLGWQWIQFHMRSGHVERGSLTGLSVADGSPPLSPRSLVEVQSSQTIMLLEGPAGHVLAQVAQQVDQHQVSSAVFTSAYAIAGSPGLSQVAVLSPAGSGASRLSLLDPHSGFSEVASLSIDQHAAAVTLSRDGKFAFVSLSAGGVLAVAIGPQSLTLAAILHEALGQVVANASDGRMVSGSVRSPRELITWDTRQWLPLARTQLPVGDSPFGLPTVALQSRGDRMLALAAGNLHAIDMSAPLLRRVTLGKPDATAQVRMGVRAPVANLRPETRTVQRSLAEDADDSFQLTDLMSDDSHPPLWFTLDVPARHGTLQAIGDGRWKYVPEPNYFGEDQATLRVFDGEQSGQLVMRWNVTPVHDVVTSVSAGNYVLPENAEHGTRVGPISVVDPDREGSYQITTSDQRFEIYGGQLFFVAGELDYETEPQISFTITALDYYSDYSVSTSATVSIIDVNEKPFSLRLSGGQVPENEPGAVVGNLTIVDPDASADYAFYLFDSRFTLVGNTLKLVSGVALDYETEPVVKLNVAATDGIHEIYTVFHIQVIDRDDGTVSVSAVNLDSRQVEERVPGAAIGLVSVLNPRDPSYQFSVSDARFEIVGRLLKLRDNQQLTLRADAPLSLTVTATGNAGDLASGVFTLNIIANQSPYHNSRIAEDVNGDGYVSPIDVLIIVNSLNLKGTYAVPTGGTATGEPPAQMPDVNDDGVVSPVDALLIINHINRNFATEPGGLASGDSEPEAEGEAQIVASGVSWPLLENEGERRRRENSTIDTELELLLDQLLQAKRTPNP